MSKVSQTASEPRTPLWPVGVFTLGYLFTAVLAAWGLGNAEFGLYIGVMFVLIVLVTLLHRAIGLSALVLWGLSIWGLLHMAGGLMPVPENWPIEGSVRVLYSLWLIPQRLKYDNIVHAYGFFITTWVCWEAWRAILANQTAKPRSAVRPTAGMLLLCAAAGMGFGALNEVIEFTATILVPETNVGGYVNTGWDLVANMVGSMTAALLIWVTARR